LEQIPKHKKAIIQYDLNGHIVKQFTPIREASKEYSIREQNISAVCRGIEKTAGGFKWKIFTISSKRIARSLASKD